MIDDYQWLLLMMMMMMKHVFPFLCSIVNVNIKKANDTFSPSRIKPYFKDCRVWHIACVLSI